MRTTSQLVAQFVMEQTRARFALRSVEDLFMLPTPEWMIEGLLQVGAQGVLYGPSGHGKTFVALDWALCVATGTPWQQKAIKKGNVLYVVSEGGRSIQKRVAAWLHEHALKHVENSYFVLEPVQLRNDSDYIELFGTPAAKAPVSKPHHPRYVCPLLRWRR